MTQSSWTSRLEPESEAPPRPASEAAPKKAPRKTNGTAEDRERSRVEAFLAAALEGEVQNVRTAGKGTRNNTLNIAALKLGSLIGAGLNKNTIIHELTSAAKTAGLTLDEISKTIASGMAAGEADPRGVPPAKERAQPANDQAPPADDYEHTESDAPDAAPTEDAPHADGQPQAKPKSRIELIEPAQIFAPLEKPRYVVDRVIRSASLTELVGYGGGFKTWTGLQMVMAVGSGTPWLGRFSVKQGRAVYLDYENGQYEMRRRAHALAKAAGLATVENIAFACMPPVYMSDPKFGAAVEPLADGASLLVVDTLKAANPGTDENDSNMRLGLDALRRVGEKTDCAFLVLVHSKKTSGSVISIDPREAGRGSSAIYDAADTVFHSTYVQGEPLRIQQTKARLGRPVDPFLVTIEDGDAGEVFVTASDAPKAETESSRVAYGKVCDEVLDLVKESPGASGRVLRARVNCRPGVVAGALETLESNGAIRNGGTERKPKWFPTGKTIVVPDEWADVGD